MQPRGLCRRAPLPPGGGVWRGNSFEGRGNPVRTIRKAGSNCLSATDAIGRECGERGLRPVGAARKGGDAGCGRGGPILSLCQVGDTARDACGPVDQAHRSEEHTSELQSLMRISYAVFCLKKKKKEYK